VQILVDAKVLSILRLLLMAALLAEHQAQMLAVALQGVTVVMLEALANTLTAAVKAAVALQTALMVNILALEVVLPNVALVVQEILVVEVVAVPLLTAVLVAAGLEARLRFVR
jgi:hypothetical protein